MSGTSTPFDPLAIAVGALTYVVHIGKESNKLEEVEHGEIHDMDEVQERYSHPKSDLWFTLVIPVLIKIPRERLAKIADITERTAQALRNRHWKPSKKTRTALTRAAGDYAREQTGLVVRDDVCACAAFADISDSRWASYQSESTA